MYESPFSVHQYQHKSSSSSTSTSPDLIPQLPNYQNYPKRNHQPIPPIQMKNKNRKTKTKNITPPPEHTAKY